MEMVKMNIDVWVNRRNRGAWMAKERRFRNGDSIDTSKEARVFNEALGGSEHGMNESSIPPASVFRSFGHA
jgi:hypothetical protein